MKALAVCLALAAVLFAGQAATASGPGPARASRTVTVGIDHLAFHPDTLRVSVGARVSFSNSSRVAHTATDKGAFDTGRIKPGQSVAVRFAQRGTFSYHCKIHPSMHGKIIVG